MLLGAMVVLAVGTILWATHREVEQTLLRLGGQRAGEGAAQIAGLLEQTLIAQNEAAEAAFRTDPLLQALLQNPDASNREAVVAAHTPENAFRRFEVWDAEGNLVLEIATPHRDPAASPRHLPVGDAPTEEGWSELRAAGDESYLYQTTEIRDGAGPEAARLGWVRQFGSMTSARINIPDLLGTDADVRIGSPTRGVWTDLSGVVPAPPLEGRGGADEDSGDGAWVAGVAPVEGGPWVVWSAFPREGIVAPAQAFTQRMALLALFLLAGGMLLTGFVAFHLTEPLHGLTRAARKIAGGDYSRRVVEVERRRDEIGQLSGAFNLMADEVERAYAELSRSHEHTHFALDAAGIGVWEVELVTGRMTCSPSLARVYGLDESQLPCTREAFLALVHPEDRASVADRLQAESEDITFDMAHRALRPDGSVRWMDGAGRVKNGPEGEPVSLLGISMDMTERRELEMRLRQAEKMEAIGQLAGGVAHDFNNLLTSIVSHGSLVLEDLPEQSEGREDVLEILRAGESAASLTRRLLTFSRRQVVHPRIVDVHDVIDNATKLLRRLLPETIECIVERTSDLSPIEIDPGELEQVVMNLAINARDAMPDGGTLTIATSEEVLQQMYSQDGTMIEPGRYVVLAVNDTGTGMGPDTVARLFEPFFTTKPPGQGTGLGLATVFGIVKRCGGHIHVYSEIEHGTTFRVYFPASGQVRSDHDLEEAAGVAPRLTRGTETILIVEDDNAVQRVARTILERSGYDVVVASSGEEALELLDTSDLRPDLVLSDVVMPGLSGPELCRRVKDLHPGVRILFTSGYSDQDLTRRGLGENGISFLEKPYTPAALTEKVREVLESGAAA